MGINSEINFRMSGMKGSMYIAKMFLTSDGLISSFFGPLKPSSPEEMWLISLPKYFIHILCRGGAQVGETREEEAEKGATRLTITATLRLCEGAGRGGVGCDLVAGVS